MDEGEEEEGEGERTVPPYMYLTAKSSPQEVQDVGSDGGGASEHQPDSPSQHCLQPLKNQLVPDGVATNNASEEEEAISSCCHGDEQH